MATVTHKVVRGDTLSAIAKKYGVTVSSIAALNNIKNTNLIYVGQVLTIKGKSSSSSSSSKPPTTSSNMAKITAFGLQANTDNVIFAIWEWTKDKTENYSIEWSYYTDNGKWFTGTKSDTKDKDSTYSAPSNAVKVRFRVKPISKKYTDKNNKEISYWSASWCSYREYNLSNNPPGVPSVPTVEIEDYKMLIRNENLNINATEIEYQIVKDDSSTYKTAKVAIKTNTSSYSLNLSPGSKYKVRARGRRGSITGDWSEYTSNYETVPNAPASITSLKALNETSIKVEWGKVSSAKTYSIEHAEKEEYFNGSNATTTIDGIETNSYIVTGLESGKRYCFRVKSVNETGDSTWSKSKAIVLGEKPEPPSTWSDRSTAMIGDKVLLSWVHNTKDGSDLTISQIEFTVNGKSDIHQIGLGSDGKPINTFEMPTFMHKDSTKIYWRVRTRGVLDQYSDWSIERVITIYAPPTMSMRLMDRNNNDITSITEFPFNIRTSYGPSSQKPIAYTLRIKSKESYTTLTPFGMVNINAGDDVYSEVIVTSRDLNVIFDAGNIDLENGIEYEALCEITMNTGLSTNDNILFDVNWEETYIYPNAEILIDKDTLSASIRPYCETYEDIYYRVSTDGSKYIETAIEIPNSQNGTSVDNAVTNTGKVVYSNSSGLFCINENARRLEIKDVSLSVYRRTHDGKFVEIETNINGNNNTFVTDPHPSLNYGRYRIVATDNRTGAISFIDTSSVDIGVESIVIQWNDVWSNFSADGETNEDIDFASSSMIQLPYNISISESNTPDTSMVNYIGRENPVSYYGTNIGVSSTWNAEFDKNDDELLYALRRLSVYMGDVYVREPSGVGYWANIKVSYDKSYNSLIIPVTFNITRVEGGI